MALRGDRGVTQSGFIHGIIYLVAAALLSPPLFGGEDTAVLWMGEGISGWIDRQKRESPSRGSHNWCGVHPFHLEGPDSNLEQHERKLPLVTQMC